MLFLVIVTGTKGLITARTGLQILKSLEIRYLGYIGLAIAVYDFVDCVSSDETEDDDTVVVEEDEDQEDEEEVKEDEIEESIVVED